MILSKNIFKILDLSQRSQEWLDFRKGKVTASMASSIMESNPWESRQQLWERLTAGREIPVNDAMRRGIDDEPKALAMVCERLQLSFDPVVVQLNTHPKLMASLDGWNSEKGIGVEIKSTHPRNHFDASMKKIPVYYCWQIAHQMMCTGAEEWYYASYCNGDLIIVRVLRNDRAIECLLGQELEFLNCLENLIPPESVSKTMAYA